MLLVLEGGEGVGKSTQSKLLSEWMTKHEINHVVLREPGGTPVGEAIRELLLNPQSSLTPATEALLFMASRAQLVEQVIEPALKVGQVVLLDRFFLSTFAYQICGRGLEGDRVIGANRLAVGELVPDITLVLDLPAEVGVSRAVSRSETIAGGEIDRIERADALFHDRVNTAFAAFASEEWRQANPQSGPVVRVDASGTPETVLARILNVLSARLPDKFKL